MAWTWPDYWVNPRMELAPVDARGNGVLLNEAGTNYSASVAFPFFSDTAVSGDYLMFSAPWRFWGLRLFVGTPMAAAAVTFVWEYYNLSSQWVALRVTNSDALLSAGQQDVLFTPPVDWRAKADRGYPVRVRLSGLAGITEGGHQSTDYVRWNMKPLQVTGTESSLAPAVTADLAGTYTLLTATTPAASLTPIEMPVKDLSAMDQVQVVLAGSTLGAGCTVTLTGIDVGGLPVTETLDVSGGNGTYTSVRGYADVTLVSCAGFADGTISVRQASWGVIRSQVQGQVIRTMLRIGNGAAATTLTLNNHIVRFSWGYWWYVTAAANLLAGVEAGGRSSSGSAFVESSIGHYYHSGHRVYGDGTIILRGCTFRTSGGGGQLGMFCDRASGAASSLWEMYDCTFLGDGYLEAGYTRKVVRCNFLGFGYKAMAGLTADSERIDVSVEMAMEFNNRQVRFVGLHAPSCRMWIYGTSNLYLTDTALTPANFYDGYTSAVTRRIWLQYTLSLLVQDEAGAPMGGARVQVRDLENTLLYDALTLADGAFLGYLTWQVGSHALPQGSAWTWETLTPHTVTVSKAGYKTLAYPVVMDRARTDAIAELEAYVAPVAGFDVGPAEAEHEVQFADASAVDLEPGDTVIYAWDFGDTGVSSERNPRHEYADDGTYDVTLTVTTSWGGSDTVVQSVVVDPLEPPRVISSVTATITAREAIAAIAERDAEATAVAQRTAEAAVTSGANEAVTTVATRVVRATVEVK